MHVHHYDAISLIASRHSVYLVTIPMVYFNERRCNIQIFEKFE